MQKIISFIDRKGEEHFTLLIGVIAVATAVLWAFDAYVNCG